MGLYMHVYILYYYYANSLLDFQIEEGIASAKHVKVED